MTKRIRVTAEPHDPVALHRLVRLLIAQAQLELDRAKLKQEKGEPPASEGQSS